MNTSNDIFKKRIYAFLIDIIILAILDTIISIFITDKGLFSYTYGKLDIYLVPKASIIAFVYYALLESSNLQASFGKNIIGLKVVDYDGKKMSIFTSIFRSISRLVSISVFGLGIIFAFFNSSRLTFHDRFTKTKVVLAK